MKKTLKVLLIIVVVLGIIIGGGYIAIRKAAGNPDDIIINQVDIAQMDDGKYIGEYQTTLVTAKVEVQVADGEIIDIKVLSHDHGPGHSGEEVVGEILNTQQIEVDTISGSTLSSKIIMKAVENALSGE